MRITLWQQTVESYWRWFCLHRYVDAAGLLQDPPCLAGLLEYRCLVAQPCPTPCDPLDCSPPGSSVRGILQARYWSGFLLPGIFPTQGLI